MASFGFNRPTAVDFRHPTQGPGFGAAPDPFASISHDRGRLEDDDAYVQNKPILGTLPLISTVLTSTTLMMA